MRFLRRPVPLWSHLATVGVVVLVLGGLAVGVAAGLLTPPWLASALGSQSVVRNEQVVTFITKEEQTVLLTLGVEGVSDAKGIPPAVLRDFPLVQKVRLVQYSMKAKLGVDAVTIDATGDHEFVVKVPPFIWIGEADRKIERVISDDGVLSAFTEQKTESEQLNGIVDDDLKTKYLENNAEALRNQAEFHFTKLARSIDPDAELTFEFAG